jgi:hypothetical protein
MEAVGDCGRFDPVWRIELAQDVRNVHACGLEADHERGGDLAVGQAAGDERQHFCLARREPAEGLFEPLRRVVWACLRWRQIEPRTLGKQLKLVQQGLRSDGAGRRRALT